MGDGAYRRMFGHRPRRGVRAEHPKRRGGAHLRFRFMQPEAESATPVDDALDLLLAAAERLHGVRGPRSEPRGDLDHTHERWRLLREVAGGERTVAEVARRLHATRAEVQPMADALVLDGLARYEAHPAPRRAQRIALTAEGARTLDLVDSSARAWVLAASPTQAPAEFEGTRRFLLTVIACADAVAHE
jgi:DNA-binding MarR family transcriptional regulator